MKAQSQQAMLTLSQTVMAPFLIEPEWTSVRMAPISHCVMLAGMMRMPECFVETTSIMETPVSLMI